MKINVSILIILLQVNRKFDEIEQQRVEADGFLNELCESLERSRIQQQLSQINKTKELQEQLVQMYSARNDELDKELEHIDMMEEISDKIMATMEASSVKNLLDVQEDLVRFSTYVSSILCFIVLLITFFFVSWNHYSRFRR